MINQAMLKRWVLSCFLKELRLGIARRAAGSWFQAWGPVNEKAVSPNLVQSLGSTSLLEIVDLSECHVTEVQPIKIGTS